MIPAIHASPGQVDHRVRPVEFRLPRTCRFAVPPDHPPRRLCRIAAEHDNFMAVGDEGPRKQPSDLSAASRDYDFHVSSLRAITVGGPEISTAKWNVAQH